MATAAAVDEKAVDQQFTLKGTSQAAVVWHRFRRHRAGMIGLVMFSLVLLSVAIIPSIVPFGTNERDVYHLLGTAGTVAPSGDAHLLGTDLVGRDELARLMHGGRITLFLALIATVAVVLIGAVVGTLAGFYGGWVDGFFMRFTDIMLSFPLLPTFLIVSKLFKLPIASDEYGQTFEQAMTTILAAAAVFVLFGWMGLGRQVRASILSMRNSGFIEAARALGAGNIRIMLKHLLPNTIAPILVSAILLVGEFIVFEAILSFMGGGIGYPVPSWGNLIKDNMPYVWTFTMDYLNPTKDIRGFLVILPGLMILITVLSLNFIGDALRDALDPRDA